MSRASRGERRTLSQYLREIREFPRLTREDEHRLLQRIEAGDVNAADSLIESNLSFVVKVAMEHRSRGVPFEDLLNEGNLGLIEAARRFDRSKGTKFITYAIWWIRKRILRAIADCSLVVRVPPHRRRSLSELRDAEIVLLTRLGRTPTREEIAHFMSVSVATVDKLLRVHLADISLDRSAVEDEAVTFSSLLEDDSVSAEERLLSEEAGLLVIRAFRRLTPREQAVLGWRLALGGQPYMTLSQIGERLELSRERVRQIEEQAKGRLRLFLARSHWVSTKTKSRAARRRRTRDH